MKKYVLTETERAVIREFLQTGKRLEGFSVLLVRIHNMDVVEQDLALIREFLAKAQTKVGS